MKTKTMNLALLYVLFFSVMIWLQIEQNQYVDASRMEEQVIPEEAIRLRILAHDDSLKEQMIKTKVRDAINAELRSVVGYIDEKKIARKEITEAIPKLEKIVDEVLAEHDVTHDVSLSLKKEVEFPTRIYGPLIYPQGMYEALVVTIGEGKGQNWWCVLFPALCFIETDTEEEEKAVDEKEKYTFFIVEKWKDWFGKEKKEEV